jgi:hypothetical protein
MYRSLSAWREELLGPDGLLRDFGQDTVRVILRPTHAYQLLQIHRSHPDRMRDALEVDRLYDMLWSEANREPCLARVIAAERRDLHQDDYPYFTTRPDSTHLWTSTGDEIKDFLHESGLQFVTRRMTHFSERDLARQIDFIRTALARDRSRPPANVQANLHLGVGHEQLRVHEATFQHFALAVSVATCVRTSLSDGASVALNTALAGNESDCSECHPDSRRHYTAPMRRHSNRRSSDT